MEKISAEKFIEWLLDGAIGTISSVEVLGNVSLRGQKIENSFRALDVTFWGEVDFSDCRFERSLDLSGCSFAKTLNLRNSHVGGSLDLNGIRVRTEGSVTGSFLLETISLDLRGMQIGGDLDLSSATIECGTSPRNMEKRGSIIADGIRVAGRTEMLGIKTDNSVRFSGSQFSSDFTFGDGDDKTARDSTGVVKNNLQLDNCHFADNLIFNGGSVRQDLNLWASHCEGVCFIRPRPKGQTIEDGFVPFSVFGAANLANIRFSYLDIEGLAVGEALKIFAAEIGQLKVALGNSMIATKIGRFELGSTNIDGDLLLPALHVDGGFVGGKTQGARLSGLKIGGSMSFWSHLAAIDTKNGQKWSHAPETTEIRAIVNGDLEVIGCAIGGELDLTNVLCAGRVVLDDTSVKRNVWMRSALTGQDLLRRAGLDVSETARQELAREVGNHTQKASKREEELGETADDQAEPQNLEPCEVLDIAPRPHLSTIAVALSMNNFSCDNDVDLTGLILADHEPYRIGTRATLLKPEVGHINAENLTVGRTLRLFEECRDGDLCPHPDRNGEGSVVPGAVNLSGANLGAFVISSYSFQPENPDLRAAESGVVLAGATVDEITIADLSCSSAHTLKLPRPMDLRDIKVGQWNIFDRKEPLLARHLTYLSLAHTDDQFRRRTWLSFERLLRDQGHSADADFIYRAMERRDELQSWQDLGNGQFPLFGLLYFSLKWLLFRKSFDLLIGYGTKPLRLLTFIVILWGLILPFYRASANFEPSLEILGAEVTSYQPPNSKPVAEVSPANWHWIDGLIFSLRYHIPVIALSPRDEWVLRDTGPTCTGTYFWWLDNRDASHYSRLGAIERSPATIASEKKTYPEGEKAHDGNACYGFNLPGAPENWALLAMIINFVAWPFILAFALNRFLRIEPP